MRIAFFGNSPRPVGGKSIPCVVHLHGKIGGSQTGVQFEFQELSLSMANCANYGVTGRTVTGSNWSFWMN
jgi:hypothetical protein